jgi:hypothetical protein
LLDLLYTDVQGQVDHAGELSDLFPLSTGVKQGCLLSPLLFVAYMDFVVRQAEQEMGDKGVKWQTPHPVRTHTFRTLSYADDLAVMASSAPELSAMVQVLEQVFTRWGFVINGPKCHVIHINTPAAQPPAHFANGTALDIQSPIQYLGCMIGSDGRPTADYVSRLKKAEAVFYKLTPTLFDRNLRGTMFKCSVMTLVLAGGVVRTGIKGLSVPIARSLSTTAKKAGGDENDKKKKQHDKAYVEIMDGRKYIHF